jgi:hypothetical protein
MNRMTTPPCVDFHKDASLAVFLAALEFEEGKQLVIEYGGREIQPGYHVTEVKAASFVALDCGGNPDEWQETILQIEDIPSNDRRDFMAVAKFRSIVAKVASRVHLDGKSRLTFEISTPETPMQIFDADTLVSNADQAILRLAARPAICKPRHRAAQEAAASSSCCLPAVDKAGCCS